MHDVDGREGDLEKLQGKKIETHCSSGKGRKPKVVNESLSEGDFYRMNQVVSRTLEDCRNLGLFGSKEEEKKAQQQQQRNLNNK